MAIGPVLAASAIAGGRPRPVGAAAVLSDYWAMTKPEVNFLIAITTAAAFGMGALTGRAPFPWLGFLHALLGTIVVASGAATLNQWLERDFDARMRRTARRPLAAGRIEAGRALVFGTLLSVAGVAYLGVAATTLAALLAAGTLLSYLFAYTPLKRLSPLCTLIGAIPGAAPPLIGWAAARGRLDHEAWVLFAFVFLWQFPHFMAIAWMYRDDYDRAGYRVLPRGESRSSFVTIQTLIPLVALLAVSLFFAPGDAASLLLYRIGAPLLGIGFLYYGARFALRKSGFAARQLLLASILYLLVLFPLMALSMADAPLRLFAGGFREISRVGGHAR